MLEYVLNWDKEILIYLNNLGNENFDKFWIFFTNQRNWIPLYVFIGILYFRFLGWKKGLLALVIIGIGLGICDQTTNLIKNFFARLRPSDNPALEGQIRALLHPHNKSFISGHASNSTLFVLFSIYLLKKYIKWIYILLIWWLLFIYSRIYMGVHYTLDILGGILWGSILFTITVKIYKKALQTLKIY